MILQLIHEVCEVCKKEPVVVAILCTTFYDEPRYYYVGSNCLKNNNLPFRFAEEGAVIILDDKKMMKMDIKDAVIQIPMPSLPIIGGGRKHVGNGKQELQLTCMKFRMLDNDEDSLLDLFESEKYFEIRFCKKMEVERVRGTGLGVIYRWRPITGSTNDILGEEVVIAVDIKTLEMIRK